MLKPSEAGFRRLIPLLRPHRRLLTIGTLCILIFVSSQLVLMRLMGQLLPDVGSGDLKRILPVIGLVLLVFAIQKLAQFGQDSLLAGPALQVSQSHQHQLATDKNQHAKCADR